MITASARLNFRKINTGDRDALWNIYSDKEAMQYRGNKPLETMEEAAQMIERTILDYGSSGECRLAIIEKESGLLIGTFLYTTISETDCVIGYSIGKDFWKKGYGLEALNQMLIYLQQMGYSRFIATTKTENISSSKLLKKAGFSLVAENKREAELSFEKEI
jgi:ribosomal-protein-alanine N-acetyltransferase